MSWKSFIGSWLNYHVDYDIMSMERLSPQLLDVVMSTRSILGTSSPMDVATAYNRCTVVRSAINKRASAYSNLNVWALDRTNKTVLNPTIEKELDLLFSDFNEYQDYHTFSHMYEATKRLFGVVYVWRFEYVGGTDYYIIPNTLIKPIYKHENYRGGTRRKQSLRYDLGSTIDYYSISYGDFEMKLSTKEVIVNYDNQLAFTLDEKYSSRLTPLSLPISTLVTIEEVEQQFMADGGARGIIGLGAKDVDMLTAPFLTSETDKIQKELKRYGGGLGKFKYLVTKGAASYTPMIPKISDLQTSEMYLRSKQEVFDAYGIPMQFAVKEPRFKSLPEAKLMFYTDTVVPEGIQTLNELLRIKGIPKHSEWRYVPDWSHLDIYSDALQKRAAALQMASQGIGTLVSNGVLSNAEGKAVIDTFLTENVVV